jgi:enoyl-CoA hydratase/carnithine racemase
MASSDILLRHLSDDGILRLTLNDVKRRNALSEAMLSAIGTTFYDAGRDPAVRVIIVAANGPAFCAGHDLKEMTEGRRGPDGGKAYFSKVMSMCSGVMQGILNCPKPVIAEVTGVATAAGCQMVATCDLAIAADTAKFITPGVHIGLFCSTPMVALSRNVSNKHAMEMLLTGDMTPAAHAAEIGLINRVTSEDTLKHATTEMARKIASKSSMTLATGKRAFYAQREMPLTEAYDYASQVMVDNMLAHDAQEGIGAFIEKRAPQWQEA